MKKVIIYIIVLVPAIIFIGVAINFSRQEVIEDPVVTPTQETCVLNLSVNDSSLGKIKTPSGIYLKNREVELQAFAINNSTFMGWYIDDELISSDIQFNYMLKEDTLIVAKFKGQTMYTKEYLEEQIKIIDLTQTFRDVKLTYIRDYAEIRLVISFDRSSSLYPNFADYVPEILTIGYYDQIDIIFDLSRKFQKSFLNCFDEEFLPSRVEISQQNLTDLLKKITFDKELFSNFVSVSGNPINDILNILENNYTQNGEKTINISSVYFVEVDNSVPVYDMEFPILLNAGQINVIASYDIDDTIPEDPNLDEDGDYVIDATSLFNLKGMFEYNEGYIALEYRMQLYFETNELYNPALLRERAQYVTFPDSDFELHYKINNKKLEDVNFASESAVKRIQLKNNQTISLDNLYDIYYRQTPQIEGIHTIDLASLFNFYNEGGDLITNIKFNVKVEINFYN